MKDDIWPNPLQYYLSSELEPVSGQLDDEDDDEEGDEDFEDEEEEEMLEEEVRYNVDGAYANEWVGLNI